MELLTLWHRLKITETLINLINARLSVLVKSNLNVRSAIYCLESKRTDPFTVMYYAEGLLHIRRMIVISQNTVTYYVDEVLQTRLKLVF